MGRRNRRKTRTRKDFFGNLKGIGSLKEKENIKGYFSYSNVDSIIEGCNILSSSNSEYAFCCEKKVVKYYIDGEESKGEFSCKELTEKAFINGRINNMMCGENICG